MAKYTSTADVIVTVNGKQAQNMLVTLEKKAQGLRKGLQEAQARGDKVSMRKLQSELNNVNKLMAQLKGSTATAEEVLKRLDKATPKELNSALRTLQRQLNQMQRGTAAWDAQIAKIRQLRAAIAEANSSLVTQQSLWQRFCNWSNNAQAAIMGVVGVLTGFVFAGRKAVNEYASMEEAIANTQKYTRMTADEVLQLNEIFKSLDTRLPREQLNLLAQEGGRLGYNTVAKVREYTEAASVINVALVDLGEGATQTIAKISNIFGIEDQFGTYDAMMKVGSTVNHLSQNCTASKPYIVDFTQRLAGVGSTAKMTVPEIMAFAATLDANGQKVEMSATAIQRIVMELFKKPEEMARKVGLNIQNFTDTLSKSTTEGVVKFLEALRNIGQDKALAVLSPLFQDLGLDGVRVASVLANMSEHLDMLKWQLGEANKAFDNGTSALNEYAIFNNTVQASIDKAKARVHELAISLGEKLYPVMRHVYTSSYAMLKVLNTIVSFIADHKEAIVALSAVMLTHTAVVKAHTITAAADAAVTKGMAAAQMLLSKAITAMKGPLMMLQAGWLYVKNGLTATYQQQELLNNSMKRATLGSWLTFTMALGSAIYLLTTKIRESRQRAEEAARKMREYRNSLVDISKASADYAAKETLRAKDLVNAANDETKSRDERKKAIEELQRLYPDYFQNMSAEKMLADNTKISYDRLRDSILEVAKARAAADKIIENEKALLDLEQQEPSLKKNFDKAQVDLANAENRWKGDSDMSQVTPAANATSAAFNYFGTTLSSKNALQKADKQFKEAEAAYNDNIRKQKELQAANEALQKKFGAIKFSDDADGEDFDPDPDTDTDTTGKSDRFAIEKAWREEQEALTRISYARGEKHYLDHTERMNQIAVEYFSKILSREDLSANERLSFQAQWHEAQKKLTDGIYSGSIESEREYHDKGLATLKQFYVNGSISKETYDSYIEQMEIEHWQYMAQIAADGSEEKQEAENRVADIQIKAMDRRRKEAEALEKEYAGMKKTYFGDNEGEKQEKYSSELSMLDIVYAREIEAAGDSVSERLRIEEAYEAAKLALKQKYWGEEQQGYSNSVEEAVMKSLDWLNSDGGKALTGTMDTLVSGMSSVFSQLSSLIQADLEVQTASIEKKYNREIELAEGNSYKVRQLEKKKEAELAKVKADANRKMFAQQVIQAVAQTATNALNAFGSAAAIPVVGYVLAPIAAAMAIAAGAVQIAAIKKQQQASEATGYATGGFTPKGPKEKPVGIVHAGEWVASQALVNNPGVRPVLDALDYAQRNNRIGSITGADISGAVVTPPAARVASLAKAPTVVVNTPTAQQPQKELTSVMERLDSRLNEPFVTVNTVEGDKGMKRSLDEHTSLVNRSKPRYKR